MNLGSTKEESVDLESRQKDMVNAQLYQHLSKTKEQMKATYDKGIKNRQFEVAGDWVYFKIHIRQHSLIGEQKHKLSAKHYVRYKILEQIRPIAYKLILPEIIKIHLVVHVLLLKKQLKCGTRVKEYILETIGEDREALIPRGQGHFRSRDGKMLRATDFLLVSKLSSVFILILSLGFSI